VVDQNGGSFGKPTVLVIEDDERTGCDGYVSKPIDTRALPGLVSEILRSGGAPQ
jgi:hypothetical protein